MADERTDWLELRSGVAPVWARYTDLVVERGIGVLAGRIAQDVRERREVHAAQERLEVPAVLDGRAGERHRPVGATVEAAAERDDPRPMGGVLGQLDGRLDRLRPGVREEEPGLFPVPQAWEGARQALVELQSGLVVQDVLLGVDDPARLLGNGRRHAQIGRAHV